MAVDPNAAFGPSRAGIPVQIDKQSLSAVTSYTSRTWPAGAYRKIVIDLVGTMSGFTYVQFQANADASAKYVDLGTDNNTAVASDSSGHAILNWARCGVSVAASGFSDVITFFPLTTGGIRTGTSVSSSITAGATTTMFQRGTSFGWTDTSTDVTFVTISTTTATFTGTVIVLGYPA